MIVIGILAFWGATGRVANANIIIRVDNKIVKPNGDIIYVYSPIISRGERVGVCATDCPAPGLEFTIHDFNGLIAGSVTNPNDWSFSSSLVGPEPPGVTVVDDPNIANLTWTYTGSATITGPAALGEFSATSILGGERNGIYSAQAFDVGTGLPSTNVGTVAVPTAVPEPSTLAMLCIGILITLGYAVRWRAVIPFGTNRG